MAQDKKSTVVLDLDNKEFVKKLKESLGLLGEIGGSGSESVGSLSSTFLKVGAVAGVAAAAILAVKTALDLAVEAEHIKQINNSFDAMAKSAGLAGDVIKRELITAAHGLADDTDILEAANKAIVSMGGNAKHLGETMELARKATVLFGGDLVQNFESLNAALAAGNTRGLRQFGIIVDQDKAYKEYAKSLGVSVKYLDDNAKKQAVMNAALEQGKQKFKDVDESVLGTTNNLKKMSVSFGELKEAAILAWDKVAGPTVKKVTGDVADLAHRLAVNFKAIFADGEEQKTAQKESLQLSIKQLETQLKIQQAMPGYNADVTFTAIQLKKQREELEKIEELEEQNMQHEMKKSAHEFKPEAQPAAGAEKPGIDYEKLKEDRRKFEKELEEIRMKRVQSDLEFTGSEEQAVVAFNDRKVEMEKQAQMEIQRIKKEAADLGLSNNAQTTQAIDDVNTNLKNHLLDNERELQEARINALNNYQNRATTASSGISAAFKKGSMQSKQDLTNWGKTGGMMFDSVKNRAVSAFKGMGDGSKSASQAMRGFMFGAIGDTATAKGTEMLLSGIWPPNPIAIAGGGALIALGSALSSQAEGSSKVSTGGGGGGGVASASAAPDLQEAKPEAQQQERKAVSVNIHGNLYETDQTRTRLMDMIREAGDFTDFNISKIGQ